MGSVGETADLVEVQALSGHTDRVWSVSWSPNGNALASCSGDKTVRIWVKDGGAGSAGEWRCKHVLEGSHTKTIRSCEWSPCGRLLATASFDMTTGIWERVADGFQFVASLEGHENEVKSASWSPSGSFLATCGRDKSVWIWEVAPGNEYDCAAVLNGHKGDVKMVCWHPHRELLLSASYDDSMKVWQEDDAGDDWLCAQTLGGHISTVWAAAFDSSGDRLVSCRPNGYIASGAADDCIRIFGEQWRKIAEREAAHGGDVNSVRWHTTDKQTLASGGDDCLVKIWEIRKKCIEKGLPDERGADKEGRLTGVGKADSEL